MDFITHAELRSLAETTARPCVSIYMPTHNTGRDVREDPIRLKDLIRTAEEAMASEGIEKRVAAKVLEPARALLDDAKFWQASEKGLAILSWPDNSRLLRTSVEVPESAVVADRFDIRPLLAMAADRQFYILALSKGAVRLLECGAHRHRLVDLPADMATSMDQAILSGEERPATKVQRGGNPTNPHSGAVNSTSGQAENLNHKEQEDLMFFLRQIDDGVRRVVRDQTAMFVLAGDESIVPFYRKASGLKNIVTPTIQGNPEHVKNSVLADRARDLLQPYWDDELNELQERYGDGTAQGLSSHDAKEIAEAACEGRVDVLFVPVQDTGPDPEPSERAAIDEAIQATLLNSGRIVPVQPGRVPGNRRIAAIFRYARPAAMAS